MTQIQPAPIYESVVEKDGKAKLPWILFFNSLFKGDTGTDWSPVFTSLTISGTPTITGKHFRLGSFRYFWIRIVPATSTTAVAGTTYAALPFDVISDGICFAVSGLLGSNSGMVDASTNRCYVPAWTAVTVPLTVVGFVEAN
jgi:hypothetical protein